MKFSSGAAACVVVASGGYPEKYASGYPITMTEEAKQTTFVAGAKLEGETLVTAGGRVLGVTATAPTLK